MKSKVFAVTVGAVVIAGAGLLLTGPKPAAQAAAQGARRAVVVELFTSEGCSDCPPADALATRLRRSQPVAGADVIVLGEHVDYWNSARWSDRFSQHTFSERQVDYAEHLHLDSPYTPQIVVDGHTDVLGSDRHGVERAIAEATAAPKADVRLSPEGDGVRVHVDHFPVAASGQEADVVLAITENGLRTHVGGGENAGRWLEHSAVVRTLRVIGSISVSPSSAFDTAVPVRLVPGGKRENTEAVVFVQARASRRVLGAASLPL